MGERCGVHEHKFQNYATKYSEQFKIFMLTIFNTCVSDVAECVRARVYLQLFLVCTIIWMHEAANTRLFWRICLSLRFVLSFSIPFSVFFFFILFLSDVFDGHRHTCWLGDAYSFCFVETVLDKPIYHFEILFSMLVSRFNGNTSDLG